MNKATDKRLSSWQYLSALNPDLVLLQEVNSLPDLIRNDFSCSYQKATNKNGLPQKFGTAVLVKGKIINSTQLASESEWVNEKLNLFRGNFLAVEIILENEFRAIVVSVHSPAWKISLDGLDEVEFNKLKLKNSSDIWGTELIWSALINFSFKNDLPLIVGGDFNSSPTFDFPKNRGNQEFLNRMNELDLKECLFQSQGLVTPTFKNPSNRKIIHQIDHLFVSSLLMNKLMTCRVEKSEDIFDSNLSDHLPIIADFK